MGLGRMLIERKEEQTHKITISSATLSITCTDRKRTALGVNQRLHVERLYLRFISTLVAFLCRSHVAADPDLHTCYTVSTAKQSKMRTVFINFLTFKMGYAVAQFVDALRYKSEGRGFDSRWCHWNFSSTQSFWLHYGPGVDSASNRNEYREYLFGGKDGRCVGLTTLPSSCTDCLEMWELQPPGTLRACPGL